MKKEFSQLQIRNLINKRDPALLFDLGAPEDEYMGEAYLVREFLLSNPDSTREQISQTIKNIFTSRFTPETVDLNPGAYDLLAGDIVELLSSQE